MNQEQILISYQSGRKINQKLEIPRIVHEREIGLCKHIVHKKKET